MLLQSWVTPKANKGQPSKIHGKGLFALQPIAKGEVIAVKLGHVIDKKTLEENRDIIQDSELQISDELYLAPLTDEEFPLSMIYFNHSCQPNAGLGGNNLVVTMKDIAAGEEITVDYATYFSNPTYSMQCKCQNDNCRHVITGNDWKMPELQQKYDGYFSWYIDQKIKQSKQAIS